MSILKKIFITAAAFIFFFIVSAVILYKTGLIINLIERLAGNYTDMTVEIGGIDFQPERHKLLITDVSVSGHDKDDVRITFPRIEIDSSLSGLLAKNIQELRLSKPSVFLPVRKVSWKRGGGGKIDLPFQRADISEASVILQVDAANVLHIDTINVSLARDADNRLARVTGSARISELESRLMVEAEIDTGRPALNKGHIGISARDLDKAKKYTPALKSGCRGRDRVEFDSDAARFYLSFTDHGCKFKGQVPGDGIPRDL
jgi:hypothetical protein